MCNAASGVPFGTDDVVHTNAGEDAGVGIGVRLGPNVLDPKFHEVGCGQVRGFEATADADDDLLEILHSELLERLGVGGVSDE